jgi:cytoskeletal protein CcmA (bactofilin family)
VVITTVATRAAKYVVLAQLSYPEGKPTIDPANVRVDAHARISPAVQRGPLSFAASGSEGLADLPSISHAGTKRIKVNGGLQTLGDLSVRGATSLQATTIEGSLSSETVTVKGPATLSGSTTVGTLMVDGATSLQATTINTTLSVTSKTKLAETEISGKLSVSDTTNLHEAAVAGKLDVQGQLAVNDLSVRGKTCLQETNVAGPLSCSGKGFFGGGLEVAELCAFKKDVRVTGDLEARNGLPLKNQLVHRRPLYGIGGQTYKNYTNQETLLVRVYGPFEYAVPQPQAGATRYFRLYAVYTDFLQTSGSFTAVTFKPWAGGSGKATFKLPLTWGNYDAYRDGFSNWLEGQPMTGHAEISLKTVGAGSTAKGQLAYLEMEAWDYFE